MTEVISTCPCEIFILTVTGEVKRFIGGRRDMMARPAVTDVRVIHLDRTHVHKAFSGRIHLNFPFNCFRALTYTSTPLSLVIFLGRNWRSFFSHFEYAQEVGSGYYDVEESFARCVNCRRSLSCGGGRGQLQTSSKFYTARG